MSISDVLIPEFDQEMSTTRRLLERVPSDKFGWKPHDKSMEMGRLASHLATLPGWTGVTLSTHELDFASSPYNPPKATTSEELLAIFDKEVAQARAALAATKDETFFEPWTLRNGDHKIFTLPKAGVMRAFVISHIIHHRGQLSVYLRLNDIPVPSIYGPSADEGGM
jgi:uncharacterized damage-inducible protein DinB